MGREYKWDEHIRCLLRTSKYFPSDGLGFCSEIRNSIICREPGDQNWRRESMGADERKWGCQRPVAEMYKMEMYTWRKRMIGLIQGLNFFSSMGQKDKKEVQSIDKNLIEMKEFKLDWMWQT